MVLPTNVVVAGGSPTSPTYVRDVRLANRGGKVPLRKLFCSSRLTNLVLSAPKVDGPTLMLLFCSCSALQVTEARRTVSTPLRADRHWPTGGPDNHDRAWKSPPRAARHIHTGHERLAGHQLGTYVSDRRPGIESGMAVNWLFWRLSNLQSHTTWQREHRIVHSSTSTALWRP